MTFFLSNSKQIATSALIFTFWASTVNAKEITEITNYSSLALSNSHATNVNQRLLYQNTLNYVQNLKSLSQESKQELDARLSGLQNYVLYPLILTTVIKKFPNDYPLIKYLDYYTQYFPTANFSKEAIDSSLLTLSNNGDYNAILDIYNKLGKDYPYNLTALCAVSNAIINTSQTYDYPSINNTFNRALEESYINSCGSFLRSYVNYGLVDNTNNQVVKDFILKNSNYSRVNLIKRIDFITRLNQENNTLAQYAIQLADNPKIILERYYPNNADASQVDLANLRFLATKIGFKDDNSLIDYVNTIEQSSLPPELKQAALAQYIDVYFFRISPEVVNRYIGKYNTDRVLENSVRRAIINQQPYLQYIELMSEDKQNSTEWTYWKAKALAQTNPRQSRRLMEQVLEQPGFYGLLASKALNKPFKVANNLVKPLDKSPNLKQDLPWYNAAIKEANELNDTTTALYLWRNFDVDKSYTGLINWSYNNGLYYLGVNSSIRQGLRDNLAARFPNAYTQSFTEKTQNLTVSKTFAQAIARQESAWNYNATSSARAYGLMQFINATARRTAQNMGIDYSGYRDLFDPEYAISLGTYHLSELLDANDNNRALAAIGYNAGPGRITQWLRNANGRLSFDEFVATIPFNETRNYVMNTITFDYYLQILQGVKNPVTIYDREWNRKY